MAYALQVMVVDKNNKGLSGQKVKQYGGDDVYTDSSGIATVVAKGSSADVYVNGRRAWSGSASSAPNPIVYVKR